MDFVAKGLKPISFDLKRKGRLSYNHVKCTLKVVWIFLPLIFSKLLGDDKYQPLQSPGNEDLHVTVMIVWSVVSKSCQLIVNNY